jgi:uncharacterized membrane protein
MNENDPTIDHLLGKLQALAQRQEAFSSEIRLLREELERLKAPAVSPLQNEVAVPLEKAEAQIKEYAPIAVQQRPDPLPEPPKQPEAPAQRIPKGKSNLERFIGENLINKIGIAIIVIGVAIGAKYSIENELINPLTRVVLGYLCGLALLGFGIRAKAKYPNYSAVLVSGAMAILFFITYAAYGFYGLFPQTMAFALMVLFTVFTVVAALSYNKQVIALMGLVGAYAVPFLLGEGSGQVAFLFTYMAIVNTGILGIAFKKYWKPLYYVAFGLTWLMFGVWMLVSYERSLHFGLALVFLSLFFALFYGIFLAYKLVQRENFHAADVLLLLANSFLFYGIGYGLLAGDDRGEGLLGLFTIGNALVHFFVGVVIYRQKLANQNLFYLVLGLVLAFIAMAIPVQLDGNLVTLLWVAQAALLFWVGRTKKVALYEKLAFPLLLLAFFSLLHDWGGTYVTYGSYGEGTRLPAFINVHFLSSLLFVGALVFMKVLDRNKAHAPEWPSRTLFSKILSLSIAALLGLALYFSIRLEIAHYWNQRYEDAALVLTPEGQDYPDYFWNADLKSYGSLSVILYSLLFMALLTLANLRFWRNKALGWWCFGLSMLAILVYMVQGLYILSELRESYLEQTLSEYYHRGLANILIRYVSFVFVALALLACSRQLRQYTLPMPVKTLLQLLLQLFVVWLASSELIHWMDMMGLAASYKLALSILWGLYALLMIAWGIRKRNKTLRIAAIVLFGGTLLKLFFYDMAAMDTISKTIVFVSLGVLLLLISYLYTKYKHVISDEADL